jgi:hypothetical protein
VKQTHSEDMFILQFSMCPVLLNYILCWIRAGNELTLSMPPASAGFLLALPFDPKFGDMSH